MSRNKPLIIAAVSLAAVLILAVIGPALMDWNRLRPEAEAAASAALKRPVRISGPISVRLLPTPSAILSGLSSGDASARSLRVSLRLFPLLAGRREIEDLTLSGGVLGPLQDVEAQITPSGLVRAQGRLGISASSEASITFDGRVEGERLSGRLRLISGPMSAEGNLSISAEEASLPDLVMILGQSKAVASLVASLGSTPKQIDISIKAETLDLDTLTPQPTQPITASPSAAPPQPQPSAQIAPAAPGTGTGLPSNITVNFDLTADALRWHGLALSKLQINALLDQGIITVGNASAILPGKEKLAISGTMAVQGKHLTLSPMAVALDDNRATGALSLNLAAPLGITANLNTQGLDLGFDGTMEGNRATGTASLRAASFAQTVRRFSGHLPRGGGPLAITALMASETNAVTFDQIQAKLGETNLTGRGRLDLAARTFTADLTSPVLSIAPFLTAESKPGGLSNWRLDHVNAQLVASDSAVTVDRLTGRMLGGTLIAAGKANSAGIAVSAMLKGADVGGLGLGAGGVKATKGQMDGQIRLAARGHSQGELLSTLSGDGRIEVKDGLVEGFDLAAMDSQMRKLENIGSLLGLVQAGLSGGTSRFSSLSGNFKADHGVASSQDIILVADGGGADGTAMVNFPKDRIDARFAFRLATPGSPPLGLRLEGPLASPNKALDINALQRYLVEHGLGKAIKGKAGGLIESLLGVKRREKP